MGTDLIFRILLGLLFIAFVAHRGYYTRKFNRGDGNTLKEREDSLALKLANLLSIPALLATALYIIYPPWMAWSSIPLPTWLRWGGVMVAMLGFALLQWAHQALGENWSDTPRLLQEQVLVASGPYRWVRHPIYTAFLLIMSSTLFISANWFIGALWIGMTAIEVVSRMQYEEALLSEHFGDQYLKYMKSTGRLLPRMHQ
jgi:protein-S-isoprenylcysteine O-methyltransferase Ste14